MRASLVTDHRRVILFFACLIFTVDLDRKIILTMKYSRSTVASIASIHLAVETCSNIVCTFQKMVLQSFVCLIPADMHARSYEITAACFKPNFLCSSLYCNMSYSGPCYITILIL